MHVYKNLVKKINIVDNTICYMKLVENIDFKLNKISKKKNNTKQITNCSDIIYMY